MVLSKEQYMEAVKKIIGEDTSEDGLKLLEDLTDTYEAGASNKGDTELQKKYDELTQKHSDLTKRYKERFFAPSKGDTDPINEPPANEPDKNENPDAGVSYSELLGGEQ